MYVLAGIARRTNNLLVSKSTSPHSKAASWPHRNPVSVAVNTNDFHEFGMSKMMRLTVLVYYDSLQ